MIKNMFKEIKVSVLYLIIISVVIVILIPITLEHIIYRNNFYSVLSNGEWNDFFGSFLGGIIGAVIAGAVTIIGISLSIKHNTNLIKQEREHAISREWQKEVRTIKPFIYCAVKSVGGGLQNVFLFITSTNATSFCIEFSNIGLNTAVDLRCDMEFRDFNGNVFNKDIFESKKILLKGEKMSRNLAFPLNAKSNYEVTIEFYDLMSNKYTQKLIFEMINDKISCTNETPKLIN